MARTKKVKEVAVFQPDDTGTLQELTKEFITKLKNIDHEIEVLKEDRKTLIEEYESKLDLKTLKIAIAVVKKEVKVEHKDTYDIFKTVAEESF